MESITAISTPAGSGGLAIIRLSGDDALEIADKVWRGSKLSLVASHTAHLGELIDENGNMLDQCVATVFHKDRSFTGEPTVEFSIHGSVWLQREVINLLIRAGASPASPGEFSRRAFVNGRLDLTQAEAIADMISASSAAAARIAGTHLKGAFSEKLNSLRENMISLASLLELELDFSEEDVEFADRLKLLKLCDTTISEILRLTESFRSGRVLKEGVTVVIAGVPNVGKSTLLNHLLQEEKAIVSDIPGTTRDVIEDTAEINGILYRFYDTAGLRPTDDPIENIGISKALEKISKADFILMLIDPSSPAEPQLREFQRIRSICNPEADIIKIRNKADIPEDNHGIYQENETQGITAKEPDDNLTPCKTIGADDLTPSETIGSDDLTPEISISAKTGEGTEQLMAMIEQRLNRHGDTASDLLITNARHYEHLKEAAAALERVREALTANLPGDLIAQDLRQAIHHIGQITGKITTDTLLHTIFSHFCIGK